MTADRQSRLDARLRRQDALTLHSARRSYLGARPGVDPAVARLGDLLRPHAGDITAIAQRAGVSRQCVRKWLANVRCPTVINLRAMLNAVGYDIQIVKRRRRQDD